jgi:hypothetical protein
VDGLHVPGEAHVFKVLASTQVAAGGWLQVTPAHRLTQAPDWHTGAEVPQPAQATPPVPHWLFVCDETARQTPPLQQPAQLLELHDGVTATQVPWLHSVPLPHGTVLLE